MKLARTLVILALTFTLATPLACNDGDSDDNAGADIAADAPATDVTATPDVEPDDVTLPDEEITEEVTEPPAEVVEEVVEPPEEVVEEVVEPDPVLADLEDLGLAADGFWNGDDESGAFTSGSLTFLNNYNSEYMSWDGYAASTMTDTTTPGWDNQYSAIPGAGFDGSATYAVAYDGTSIGNQAPTFLVDEPEGGVVLAGLYVTNTTYTYLSMLEGDDYAKKFGGETGEDPDWFLVTFAGYDAEGTETGTVEFYLADFRSDAPAEDYILADWAFVELDSLGVVSEVRASLSSSDNGDWGMNTPAFFALDHTLAAE